MLRIASNDPKMIGGRLIPSLGRPDNDRFFLPLMFLVTAPLRNHVVAGRNAMKASQA